MDRREFLKLAASVSAGAVLPVADRALGAAASSPTKRPNFLFIVCDDLNQSLGCYGNSVVKTPNIDRLAARGVRFERAHCNYPLCLPSRHSFLTGLRPDARFELHKPLRESIADVEYLPQVLREQGYFTARIGKAFHTASIFAENGSYEDAACWDLSESGVTWENPDGYGTLYASIPHGVKEHPELNELVAFRDLLNNTGNCPGDYWIERAGLKLDDAQTVDGNICGITRQVLSTHANEKRPFFVLAGFRRPHEIWAAPEKYFQMYSADEMKLPEEPPGHDKLVPEIAFTRRAPNMTDAQRRMAIQSYYACVSSVDHQIGLLLDEMDRLKLWDNTYVVLTADHGYHLGEHGMWGKVSLFQESAKVPLIIAGPGIKPGVCPATVESVDLFPTVVSLAGLNRSQKVDGVSLVPQLENPQAPHAPAFSIARHKMTWGKAIYTEDWRYTEWGDNAAAGAELYDLKNDPKEYKNLANDPAYAEQRAKLKALLDPVTKNLRDSDPRDTAEG